MDDADLAAPVTPPNPALMLKSILIKFEFFAPTPPPLACACTVLLADLHTNINAAVARHIFIIAVGLVI